VSRPTIALCACATLALLLATPAQAGDRNVAPGAAVHLGMTLLETGYPIALGAGLLAQAGDLESSSARNLRTAGGLLFASATVQGLRAGLALELVHTTVQRGWEPTRWRAAAAILSGSLHLVAAGLGLGAFGVAQVSEAELGVYQCYVGWGCGGPRGSPLGAAILVEAVFVAMAVPYTIVEMLIGIEAAKRLRPRAKRKEGFVMTVSPTGIVIAGRF